MGSTCMRGALRANARQPCVDRCCRFSSSYGSSVVSFRIPTVSFFVRDNHLARNVKMLSRLVSSRVRLSSPSPVGNTCHAAVYHRNKPVKRVPDHLTTRKYRKWCVRLSGKYDTQASIVDAPRVPGIPSWHMANIKNNSPKWWRLSCA